MKARKSKNLKEKFFSWVLSKQIMVMEIVISVILLLVGIAVLVVIHVCIVGRAFRRGFTNGTSVQRSSSSSIEGPKMSHGDLEKLPCFDYITGGKGNYSPVDCAVCLETFKMGEKCRFLPTCKHSFHSQCIDSWLLKTPICPICRTLAINPPNKDTLLGDAEVELT